MVVLDQRRQGVLDRRDLVGGDIAERGEDQGVIAGELGQVGEIGLGEQIVGHAGRRRLVLGGHEELGIGGWAEVLGGRGCREDDADLVAGVGDDRQGGGVDDGVGADGVVTGQEGGVVDVGQNVDGRGGTADLGQRQAELDSGLVGAERVGQGCGAGQGLAVSVRVEVGLAIRREVDVVVVAAIGSENLVAGQSAPVRVQPDRSCGSNGDGRFQCESESSATQTAIEFIAIRRRAKCVELVGGGPVCQVTVNGAHYILQKTTSFDAPIIDRALAALGLFKRGVYLTSQINSKYRGTFYLYGYTLA